MELVHVLLSLHCQILQTTHVLLAILVTVFSVILKTFVHHAKQAILLIITTVSHAPLIIVFHVH